MSPFARLRAAIGMGGAILETGPLAGVRRLLAPHGCIDQTMAHLRQWGASENEGLVLWAGTRDGEAAAVREVIVPAQQGVRTESGIHVAIRPEELHRLNVHLYTTGQLPLGQVHSHPGEAYHSRMDDEHAVATLVGSYSVVVPDFAARPFLARDCAVHKLSAKRRWVRLPPNEAEASLEVVS